MLEKRKKKLLILTQKVDINDDLLGFFHGWIREFANNCENITVIALGIGKFDLPENVKVVSLGKEKSFPSPPFDSAQGNNQPSPEWEREHASEISSGMSYIRIKNLFRKIINKFRYSLRFYSLIIAERKNYDTVFVHMNKEYAVLGGIVWKAMGKKVYLWYNHIKGNWISTLAGMFSKKIFYTSPFSFFSKNTKAQQMPVGVDTQLFKDEGNIKQPNSILCLGRISPVKNLETLLNAAIILDEQNIEFKLNIVGDAPDRDKDYYEKIKNIARPLEAKGKIEFFSKVPFLETRGIYNQNEVFVNMTNSGSLDKTTFEAMACGMIPLISNESFRAILPEKMREISIFKENDPKDLAKKFIDIRSLDVEENKRIRESARQAVEDKHSLHLLVKKIFSAI